jgi:hypothetical protein
MPASHAWQALQQPRELLPVHHVHLDKHRLLVHLNVMQYVLQDGMALQEQPRVQHVPQEHILPLGLVAVHHVVQEQQVHKEVLPVSNVPPDSIVLVDVLEYHAQ